MEKKELLFFVILVLFCSNAIATPSKEQDEADYNARFEFKIKDLEYAKDIRKRSMQMNMPTIKKKWYDLQEMLGNEVDRNNGGVNNMDELTSNTLFRIFVSSSMSINLLKSYAKSAKKYNAISYRKHKIKRKKNNVHKVCLCQAERPSGRNGVKKVTDEAGVLTVFFWAK